MNNNSSSPFSDHLCMMSLNKWSESSDNFNKPLFEYMKQKYTIYEIESWPEEIPKPPLDLTPSVNTYDISGDWETDWEGLTALEADSHCPPGWYFDRELKECVKNKSTHYR